ncbi:hypothetical protein H4219_004276 [Mycoemilia scoparia]|uniref:Uncharacterized protein n=1 Tax=Mycoemilia scoparia TaxID=417184 RepID=A0A9W7ZT37_9FUNG|nr:hypothetical protein H4219_004276 [Mycoemilia scoparia]
MSLQPPSRSSNQRFIPRNEEGAYDDILRFLPLDLPKGDQKSFQDDETELEIIYRFPTMSSKFNANVDYYTGAAKEKLGSALGKTEWEADGAARKAKGEAEYEACNAKDYKDGAVDKIKGHGQSTLGSITGDTQQQAEGAMNKAKGDAKMKASSK